MHRFKSPLIIFLVALLLRLGLLAYGQTYRISPANDHVQFGGEIGRIARSIAHGHGFSSPYWAPTGPTAQQPPVYPYLLAGSFKLFGVYTPRAAFAILSLNSLFSSLTCIFLLLIGREAFGETVGTLAAWVWVFWPSATLFPITGMWSETLAGLCLSSIIWMTLRLERSRRINQWLVFGAVWGLAALADPAVLAALPFLAGWLWYRRHRSGLPSARLLASAAMLAGIVVLPWLVRNYEVFRRPVFIRDDFGLELHVGNHPGASGAYRGGLWPMESGPEWAQYRRLGELAYMSAKRRQALSFITSHPVEYAWLCLQRLGELWIWTGNFRPFGSVFPSLVWQIFYFVLPALGLAGLLIALRKKVSGSAPLFLVLLAFSAVYVIIEYSPRHRYPIEPELVLLGTYAVVTGWRRMRGRVSSPVALGE